MKKFLTSNTSLTHKKRFYLALYSSIGMVLLLTAIISFNNIASSDSGVPQFTSEQTDIDFNELEMTTASNVRSYLTPEEPETELSGLFRNKKNTDAKTEEKDENEETDEEAKAKSNKENDDNKNEAPDADNSTSSIPETNNDDIASEEPIAEPVFRGFTNETKMSWPIMGEIVMDYSTDRPIYDITLNQYRTNDSIAIAANIGDQVKATSDGVVSKIYHSREDGHSIVIDHGNGWSTTYSQLQEGILVSEGDFVKEGQVIGGVASPSIYGVLLGNHLVFKISNNGEVLDPKKILASN